MVAMPEVDDKVVEEKDKRSAAVVAAAVVEEERVWIRVSELEVAGSYRELKLLKTMEEVEEADVTGAFREWGIGRGAEWEGCLRREKHSKG